MSESGTRDSDVTVFGASGFVGRLTAGHLAQHLPDGVRVALAGRSRDKLEAVRRDLGERAADWPIVVADSTDDAALAALAAATRVVLSTVGPYARHGLPLVRACVAAGTDYADLTGEVPFVRASIDAAHEAALASGARIVHACGFDSVPSELGVLETAQQARADDAGTLAETTFVLVSARASASGGTVDSMRMLVDQAKADSRTRALLTDAYSLSPDRAAEPVSGGGGDFAPIGRVDGRWTGPFLMASFNTRIVRRSNALTGYAYGRELRYREVMAFGRSPAGPALAAATAAGIAGVGAGMALPPTRYVLDRLLPKPGDGPDEATRRNGHFTVEVTATTTTGAKYRTTVAATGDPGYAATAVMLGESGLCLALGERREGADEAPGAVPLLSAGVLTPATAMGSRLSDRLRADGFRIRTERVGG